MGVQGKAGEFLDRRPFARVLQPGPGPTAVAIISDDRGVNRLWVNTDLVRASGLEMILADVSGLELAYALNFGLLLATLFHLSDWRALEYTGEAHPTHG